MSNPTLASITAELEAVETAARGRGSLTCDHLAGRIANIRGELQQIAQPQPPAEAQAQGGGEVVAGELRPCPFCGKSNQDRYPCEWLDGSGANVIRCAWCHGAAPMNVWNRRTAPSAPVGVEAALRIAHRHLDMDSMRVSHCKDAAAIEAALSQQPAAVDEAIATASDRDLLKMVAAAVGLKWRKDIEEERAAVNIFGLWITNQDGSLGNTAWNPLHSSSDAFHLAVELGISVCVRGDAAATRRAIVHAALAPQQGERA